MHAITRVTLKSRSAADNASTTEPLQGWLGRKPTNYTPWLLRRGNPKQTQTANDAYESWKHWQVFLAERVFVRFVAVSGRCARDHAGQLMFSAPAIMRAS
jgi:hypothetical protein